MKLAKAQVNYRVSTDPGRRCGTCSMFLPPDGCSLVAGTVRPDDVCDRWAGPQRKIDWWVLELRVQPPSPADIKAAVEAVKGMPDSGDHGHVPAVFPIDPKPLPPIPEGAWGKAQLKTTKFKNLYASNEQLQRADLLWHVQNPGKSRFEGKYNTHAQVFEHKGGDRVVVDGNHRLAALKVLGLKKDKVWLLREKDLPSTGARSGAGLLVPQFVPYLRTGRVFEPRAADDVAAAVAAVKQFPVDDKGRIAALLPVYPDDIPDLDIEQWGDSRSQPVPLDGLYGHHKHLRPDRLIWHLNHLDDPSVYTGPTGICPFVYVDKDGCPVVADGDHRVTAMKLAGADKVTGWVLDQKTL